MILVAVVVLVLLTVVLKEVTPEEIGTTAYSVETTSSDVEDLQNAYAAAAGVLSDRLLAQKDLESSVRAELGEAYSSNIIVFLSVSDGKEAANVVSAIGATLEDAWAAANEAASAMVVEKHCMTKYIKADIVNDIERVATSSLSDRIRADAGIYGEYFRRGVSFDAMFEKALLEAEINSNELIDYDDTMDLVFDRVNVYLAKRGLPQLSAMPENVYLFTCRGIVKDEEGCRDLSFAQDKDYGRRVYDVVDRSVISSCVESVANYLIDRIGEDGRFVYGSYPVLGLDIDTYSAEYHALALSAVSKYARQLDSAGLSAGKLALAAGWLRDQVKDKGADGSYVFEKVSADITGGAQARAISAFCDYAQTSGDASYADLAEKLGRGLLAMLDETGHVKDRLGSDLTAPADEQEHTAAYDSAAALALTQLYSVSGKQQFLDAAETVMKMMIAEDYTQYADPTVSEAAEALTAYAKDSAYYDLALKNYTANAQALSTRVVSDPAFTRLLISTFNIYKRMQSESLRTDAFNALDQKALVDTCVTRANDLLNGFAFPEFAMYFRSPDNYVGAFFVRQDGFRIRIDDMASFVKAYLSYQEVHTSVNAELFSAQEREAASKLAEEASSAETTASDATASDTQTTKKSG